jgi:O-antigen/teichoic acid export membrane protein
MLIWVLFPKAAKSADAGEDGRGSLWKSIGLTSALSGGFCLVVLLFPEVVLRVAFGPGYEGAAIPLQFVSLAMMLLAIIRVLFTYCLAHYLYGHLWIMSVGLAAFVGLVYLFHDTPTETAAMLLLCMGGIVTASFIWFFAAPNRERIRSDTLKASREIN